MGSHLIDGQFQSDKYPGTPRGFVPLKVTDPAAQDLLWQYAQRHRERDPEFTVDLEAALIVAGYGGLSLEPSADLWAVHVEGPDSIIAAESFEEADERAREVNDYVRRKPCGDVLFRALVVRWRGTPERHAADVAKGPERWRDPC